MSRIFQTLGASPEELPGLWIAAPLTGLLVQPIIGYLSDRTWSPRWGRRRPYFMIGAVMSSLALFFMPYSSTLWMAAGFLWVLDASINISMEPFRALVADKLPEHQRSNGFVMQTLIIGIGTWIASNLPWFVTQLGVSNEAAKGEIPDSVFYSFAIGAFVFMISIAITVLTTPEDPPEDLEQFKLKKKSSAGFLKATAEIANAILAMPKMMFRLGVVQFFSWFAFFTMWSFATPALTEHVYQTADPSSAAYNAAANSVSSAMGVYGLSSMAFALLLVLYTSKRVINPRRIHFAALMIGGMGFFSMMMLTADTSFFLKWSFAMIGVAWGSMLSMPYAMLSSSIPSNRMGVYMGIFNMFIVIPQVLAALGGINLVNRLIFDGVVIHTMTIAGASLLFGAVSTLFLESAADSTVNVD